MGLGNRRLAGGFLKKKHQAARPLNITINDSEIKFAFTQSGIRTITSPDIWMSPFRSSVGMGHLPLSTVTIN